MFLHSREEKYSDSSDIIKLDIKRKYCLKSIAFILILIQNLDTSILDPDLGLCGRAISISANRNIFLQINEIILRMFRILHSAEFYKCRILYGIRNYTADEQLF